MHATNSLKARLSARTGEVNFRMHHACAKSFVALSCSFFVRDGIWDVKYCSSCDFLAVRIVFSFLEQTTESSFFN